MFFACSKKQALHFAKIQTIAQSEFVKYCEREHIEPKTEITPTATEIKGGATYMFDFMTTSTPRHNVIIYVSKYGTIEDVNRMVEGE